MEAYAKALLWAIPGFLVLVLIEIGYGFWVKKQTYAFMDTIASLSSGITNILKDSLGLAILLISYPYLQSQLSLLTWETSIALYVIAFICLDFAAYWSHRLNHHINFFWNQHIVHHSSEEFNLACALRQSISNILSFGALFLIPAALLGIPQQVINVLAPIHLFAQFWYHTKHIGKMGCLEYIIVTPSQHRVHHAINPIYIDKNLAAIFCVWDRIFGTFQEEIEEEPPVFGVLKPVHTWNPIWINFQHLWGLVVDAWYTQSWIDKLTLWFRPTGWRPTDVAKRFPRPIVEQVHQLQKYKPEESNYRKAWALFQLLSVTGILLFFLAQFGRLSIELRFVLGGIVCISIFSYTSILDRLSWSYRFEVFRLLSCALVLFWPEHWSYLSLEAPIFTVYILSYLCLSFLSLLALQTEFDLKPQHGKTP